MKKKIYIEIDRWKKKVFKRGLSKAGYDIKIMDGLTKETLAVTLQVDESMIPELTKLIDKMNHESRRIRNH